ncbi:MAG: 3-phosphoshikimate 1-carboxyvinyltransferase [Erysipelotrichales bacterium]|nr:3-phosphoshikimate 1-carboxyvinyltransferase [Erysipelotrichales bacterium]
MKIKIYSGTLQGEISVPASKSLAHRYLICAALSKGKSVIDKIDFSDDIDATVTGLSFLGATINKGTKTIVTGIEKMNTSLVINCQESGSTLRFLVPVSLSSWNKLTFTGEKKLPTRPMEPLYTVLREMGIDLTTKDEQLPVNLKGQLKAGKYQITGKVSSQFLSGLFMALPLLENDSQLIVSDGLESKTYVDLTINVLKNFGVKIENKNYREFSIKGGQKYKNGDFTVEGDYSQAAFWLAAACLSGAINLLGLNKDSLQGDKKILDILQKMNALIDFKEDKLISSKACLKGQTISLAETPDLGPILAVIGAYSTGKMTLTNGKRLKIKESDRLKAITSELKKAGVKIFETEDGLIVEGKNSYPGNVTLNSWDDHRIAMALAIFSLRCESPVMIENFSVINKSYPEFLNDFKKLGGNYVIS